MSERFSVPRALWILIRRALPNSRSLGGLALFFVLLFIGFAALQSACYPWAHSLGLALTLTGPWMGELKPAVRGRHLVFLELRDSINDEGGPDLAGTATMCDTGGQTRAFGIIGDTRNWRGTHFYLHTYISDNRDGEGVRVGEVDGEWDRGDSVRADAKLLLWRIVNGGSISTTARPRDQVALEDSIVPFTLIRASASQFRSACQRLGAGPATK